MNASRTKPVPAPSPDACALERLAHLAGNVRALWGQAEFELYVSRLIMESRDGKRQGLPWDVAQELMFLVELSIAKRAVMAADLTGAPFRQMYAMCLASSANANHAGPGLADPWSDPRANKEAGRMGRSPVNTQRAPAYDYRREHERTWWRRVFG
jgi:hypothetical protein